jgi:1,2-diacylglycerol 3-alpha-glucosyltransferase
MRVTVFTNSYKPSISGVVTSIDLFRTGLLAKGHEVSVIVPEYANYEDKEPYIFRVPAIDFSHQVDMNLAIPLRGMLKRTVSGLKPQVIHSQHPIVMGGLAASYARQQRIPLVFTFHTRYEEYAHKYIKFMPELAGMVMDEVVERYLGHCSHIIAPTSSIRDLIHRKYDVKVPVTIVPTPVDLSSYSHLDPHQIRSKLGLEECEVLLYVGRLSEEKNLTFLIRSFALLVKNRPLPGCCWSAKASTKPNCARLSINSISNSKSSSPDLFLTPMFLITQPPPTCSYSPQNRHAGIGAGRSHGSRNAGFGS